MIHHDAFPLAVSWGRLLVERHAEARDVQLQEKDTEIERLQREVQALRVKTCRISRLKSDCPMNSMIFSYVHWQVEMDTQLQQKDVQLQQKDGQLQQKDVQLQQKDGQLQQKDVQLQQKDGQLQHKDGQIQRRGAELRERTLQLNRQLRKVQTLRVRK